MKLLHWMLLKCWMIFDVRTRNILAFNTCDYNVFVIKNFFVLGHVTTEKSPMDSIVWPSSRELSKVCST